MLVAVWQKMVLNWFGSARQFNYSLLVVRYEDFKKDKVKEVSRMLDFLRQDYSRRELASRLEDGFEKFHRPHTRDDFDHYMEDQRVFVKTVITRTMEKLRSMNIDCEELKLNEYLE